MGRATKTELLWAYAITHEEFLKRVNDKIELHPKEQENIRNTLFDAMSKGETSIYEPKMNAYLEDTVYKYLRPMDKPMSLTDIARRFEPDNPSYLIQSWLRSRNTIEFLGEWERNNNKGFNEEAFQRLLKDVCSPSYTLTPRNCECYWN